MWLTELEWFVALANSGHVTKTAEQLHVSQPTLSRGIARLERQLGTPLFDRQAKRLELNEYGRILRTHATRALREIEEAQRHIAELAGPGHGVVSIGFVSSFGSWLVPDLVAEYRRTAPGVRFTFEGAAADSVVDAVLSGRVNVGITAPPPRDQRLTWSPLAVERLCLSVPDDHPLTDRREVSLEELASFPMVALRPEYGLRQVCDALCEQAGFTPEIVSEATEVTTLRGLVAASAGIAIIPSPAARMAGTCELPITDESAVRQAGLIALASSTRSQSPAVGRFVEFIREHPLIFRAAS